jgi:hypothetical protein
MKCTIRFYAIVLPVILVLGCAPQKTSKPTLKPASPATDLNKQFDETDKQPKAPITDEKKPVEELLAPAAPKIADNGNITKNLAIYDLPEKFNLTSTTDIFTFAMLKYTLAARKSILLSLTKINIELKWLSAALKRNNLNDAAIPTAIRQIYPKSEFPDFHADIDNFSLAIRPLYDEGAISDFLSSTIEKTVALVEIDSLINQWKYAKFPDPEKNGYSPDDATRNLKTNSLLNMRTNILDSSRYNFLLLPIFKNMTIKTPFEFFFFHNVPNYNFYQYLFAAIYQNSPYCDWLSVVDENKCLPDLTKPAKLNYAMDTWYKNYDADRQKQN